MNVELPISQNTLAKLSQFAAITGKSVDELVLEAVEERFADASMVAPHHSAGAHTEWINGLRNWSNSHPTRTSPVDDSRESIYEGRGL